MTKGCTISAVAKGVLCATVQSGTAFVASNRCFLLHGGGEGVLVDTAWVPGGSADHIRELLAAAGLARGQLMAVVLTHGHWDHSGHAAEAVALSGAQLLMPLAEAVGPDASDDDGNRTECRAWLRAHGVASAPAAELEDEFPWPQRPPLDEVRWLRTGSTLTVGDRCWEVLATPGHSAGHVCLLDRAAGVLLSGDHLMAGNRATVRSWPWEPPDPLTRYERSLAKTRRLPVARALPAHEPAIVDVDAAIEAMGRRLHRRLDLLAKTLLASGRSTTYEIATAMPWFSGRHSLSELPPRRQVFALSETVAHLDQLVTSGAVVRTTGQDRVTWTAQRP